MCRISQAGQGSNRAEKVTAKETRIILRGRCLNDQTERKGLVAREQVTGDESKGLEPAPTEEAIAAL